MIDVAFTRADLRAADVAVVIDVLRATSTATQALAAGYARVLCSDSIDRALALRAPGRILAGERGCVMPPGFDFGNSPAAAARCHGAELVLATTNGAPAIVAATRFAPVVLLASLLNLDAVLGALSDDWGASDVQFVCSGTDGATALEDVYVAGRLCLGLQGPRSDAAVAAVAVAEAFPRALAALDASTNARVLRSTGGTDDIAYCARESVLDTLPCVIGTEPGVATVADAAGDAIIAASASPQSARHRSLPQCAP